MQRCEYGGVGEPLVVVEETVVDAGNDRTHHVVGCTHLCNELLRLGVESLGLGRLLGLVPVPFAPFDSEINQPSHAGDRRKGRGDDRQHHQADDEGEGEDDLVLIQDQNSITISRPSKVAAV